MRLQYSAGFVIYHDHPIYGRQFLLLRHSGNGHWSFPKGLIDNNETDLEAAIRELEEETGIQKQNVSIHSTFQKEIEYSY